MSKKKTREAEPGELREIHILESLQRLFSRPESRIDAQKLLGSVSPNCHKYVKHLVESGPSSEKDAAKACGFTIEELGKALDEIEKGISTLRR